MSRPRLALALLALVALLAALAGCGDDDESSDAAATNGTTAPACARGDQPTIEPGILTVGTDKPAFPPYFIDDDPSNGKGFESAVAYAIGERLGFASEDVKWVTVPFNSSYAPGPKSFDFDINQISITPKRQEQVDFSAPYYTTPQAVLVPAGSPYAGATGVAELKDATFGVQVGTTSLDAVESVIDPSQQPQVFNDSNDTVRALKSKAVDAIVVDLPTAIYLRDEEVEGSEIVGQFPAPGGNDWGVVLAKGSALTPCVDRAIGDLRQSGDLDEITEEWIGAEAPVLALE